MKKVLAAILVSAIALSLVACGGAQTPQADSSASASSSSAAQSSASSSGASTSATTGSSSWDQWNQFLVDYEAWVDEYIVFLEKYTANPTDAGLIADYSKLAAEATDFQQRAAQTPADLTPEQIAQSTDTLTKIMNKLSAALSKVS